jgi:regulator of PEP synthase PpsR (kinase-PPPase family)
MAAHILHLVSDATGETLNAVTSAVLSQFEGTESEQYLHNMVRSERRVDKVLADIEANPGLVLFTLVSPELRRRLEAGCAKLDVPCQAVLDSTFKVLGQYLGSEAVGLPGQQHQMDADYFARIDAIQYTLVHDDGLRTDDLHLADIVLLGVSRTSKTPTCMYLANRGLKVANIPIVPNMPLPPELEGLTKVLVVGLSTTADRLVHVRQSRLRSMADPGDSIYADPLAVEDEVTEARRLFNRQGWPVIDVTRRSIEETAAAIYNLYQKHQARPAEEDIIL